MAVSTKEINSILSEYFNIIDSYFGSIKHHLGNEEDSHIDLATYMARYPLVSDLIIDAIDDIDEQINSFWQKNLKTVVEFVKQQDSLKCLYSGDISPVILENFVKRSAFYIDTVILADPIYNLTLFQKQIILDRRYYLQKLIRHVFNIWKLKDLTLLNSPQKVIIILPINLHLVNQENRNTLIDKADRNFATYVGNVLDVKLESGEACLDYLEKETTADGLFKQFKHPELLPRIFTSIESFKQFLADFSNTGKFAKFKEKESVGWDFGIYLRSQFIRVQEHRYFCERLIAEPIYDYDLPWFFFNYEMGGVDMDAAIATALQGEKFNWISNVPLSAITVMRAENKLDYMRGVLRKGITDLKAKTDKELIKVSEQVEANLKEAFDKQESEISELQNQVNKIVRKEIPITSAGFLAGFIPVIDKVVSVVCAGRDIKKALSERSALKKTLACKNADFISLLLKSYERKD